jgi:GNAT superfamily N-acetyltransferase
LAVEVEIRDAEPGDAERIAEINAEGWRTAYAGIIEADRLAALPVKAWVRDIRANLEGSSEGTFSLVALIDAEVTGSCFVASPARDGDLGPEVSELVAIYVHPGRWRQGIGSALLREAHSRAARSGSTELSLWTFRDNVGAQTFYEHHGWRRDGAEQIHPGAKVPAIRMRRPLP